MLLALLGLRERARTNRVLEAEGMQTLWRHGHDITLCYAAEARNWEVQSRVVLAGSSRCSAHDHLGNRELITLRAAQSATSP